MTSVDERLKKLQAKLPNDKRMESFKHKFKRPTNAQIKRMFEKQHNHCAICKRPLSTDMRKFEIDYDYTNNLIRGLLCKPCTNGLQQFECDPAKLERGADYLEKFSSLHSKIKRDDQPS